MTTDEPGSDERLLPTAHAPARDVYRNLTLLYFVDTMPELYPACSLDAFIALYNQVRLPC